MITKELHYPMGMLVKKCINDMRSMYNYSEKSPKVPHKLSWL